MPRIFDNISEQLQTALINSIQTAQRADFCVGYFNLRGWKLLQPHIEPWSGEENSRVRLLVGMHRTPREEIHQLFSLLERSDNSVDQPLALRLRRKIIDDFRSQLMLGAPTNTDESGLKELNRQLREKKLVVKLFLRYPLHAKLYLLHRNDYNAPILGYLGSSNLTFAGLSHQGELNTEILDFHADRQLAQWFEERWNDRWCLDISDDLIGVIEDSWANMRTPYEVYIKMAYHLAQEAIISESGEYRLARDIDNVLFDYQKQAVKLAAHHLNKRNGVLLGDVVGLGKTLMATALARMFQDEPHYLETLILCPKNLVAMWERYKEEYRLLAEVVPLSQVIQRLPTLRRYRVVIIDESHNLRNRAGARWAAIHDYIERHASKCILLSATPYNKNYLDLAAQLRLFIPETRDLGIRPERYIQEIGEDEFRSRHQTQPRSLSAFEKSAYVDDWRDLMRLYLVRRTRSFVMNTYAENDPQTQRKFLRLYDGTAVYFPTRIPRTVPFVTSEQYRRLYDQEVVDLITDLALPRYGLGQYANERQTRSASAGERQLVDNLGRAGNRLKGFCRTNLFKRLESSGHSFLQSIERHLLRNFVYLHAIASGLDLPIGTLDAAALDTATEDEDSDEVQLVLEEAELEVTEEGIETGNESLVENSDTIDVALDSNQQLLHFDISRTGSTRTIRTRYQQRAQSIYTLFATTMRRRFKWIRPTIFTAKLRQHLEDDCNRLLRVLDRCGEWQASEDAKLNALFELVQQQHPTDKVVLFSQFADTIRYLHSELQQRGVTQIAAATGHSDNPTEIAWRFSPRSNGYTVAPEREVRVLLSTDVLSEGQNLQDSAIVINFDLPWAIIRLSQRAGRVDRIGQRAERILCYSFLPAEGVEQIIRLRARVRQRLSENGEVIGSDEQFFEDQTLSQQLRDLYTENSGILDQEPETEVDLASFAHQIWLNATRDNPALENKIRNLPDVVYSSRNYVGSVEHPEGVLVYMKSAEGTDSLAWLDQTGNPVTQSQYVILRAAECSPSTPKQARHPRHHELVEQAVASIRQDAILEGGQLGPRTGARARAYERLKRHYDYLLQHSPLLASEEIQRAIDDLYQYPLRSIARDQINRQMRAGISDEELTRLIIAMRSEDRLNLVQSEGEQNEPRILCSLGLFQ